MVTHSSIIAWKIPWTEKPGRLQAMGSQGVGHDRATSLHFTLPFLTSLISFLLNLLWGFFEHIYLAMLDLNRGMRTLSCSHVNP